MKSLRFVALWALTLGGLAHAETKRTKVIDFESSTVEGINRRPWDSLNQVSEADKRKRQKHLYRKRSGFSSETRETLSEMRFTP